MNYFKKIFKILGPGLISGEADNDPSSIATSSQTGAQFGYGQLWTALFMLPLIIAIQEACARIGAVKGRGIAAIVKIQYGKKILLPLVFLIIIANVISIGADIGAMAAAAQLIVPVNYTILTFFFAILILSVQIWVNYKKFASILKWLTFVFLVYPGVF